MKNRNVSYGFLLRLLAGGALFLLLFTQLSYAHRGYDRMMRFYGIPRNSLDAVVVGSSSTFTSYMPMEAFAEQGIASAVVATNMQFEGTLPYTLREIRKYQAPKVYVIDILPFLRGHYAGQQDWERGDRNLNIRYNVDSLRYSPLRAALIHAVCRDFGMSLREEIYFNIDMVRYHMTRPDLKHFNNALKDVNYGFQHLQKEGGEPFDPEDMVEKTEKETELSGLERENLEKLLEEAETIRKSGADVFFLCQPVWFSSEEEAGRKNYLMRVITERGFSFWDLTEEKEKAGLKPAEDYRDFLHFDSLGSLKVTKLIADHLSAECNLPDRRRRVRGARASGKRKHSRPFEAAV